MFPITPELVSRLDIAVVHDLNQAEDNGFNDHVDDSDNLGWCFQLHAYSMDNSVGKASRPVAESGQEMQVTLDQPSSRYICRPMWRLHSRSESIQILAIIFSSNVLGNEIKTVFIVLDLSCCWYYPSRTSSVVSSNPASGFAQDRHHLCIHQRTLSSLKVVILPWVS